jgi:hypothetical protein
VAEPVNQVMITLVSVTVATSRSVTRRFVVEAFAEDAETPPTIAGTVAARLPQSKACLRVGPQQSMIPACRDVCEHVTHDR